LRKNAKKKSPKKGSAQLADGGKLVEVKEEPGEDQQFQTMIVPKEGYEKN